MIVISYYLPPPQPGQISSEICFGFFITLLLACECHANLSVKVSLEMFKEAFENRNQLFGSAFPGVFLGQFTQFRSALF